MESFAAIVKRHPGSCGEVLWCAVLACPEEAFEGRGLGAGEHLYHAMVGLDVWLTDDPRQYSFDEIAEDDAAQLRAPAGRTITRSHLLGYVIRLAQKLDGLPDQAEAYLARSRGSGGRELSWLDRCLTQLRHVQHHLEIANEIARHRGSPTVAWRGHGEGEG